MLLFAQTTSSAGNCVVLFFFFLADWFSDVTCKFSLVDSVYARLFSGMLCCMSFFFSKRLLFPLLSLQAGR